MEDLELAKRKLTDENLTLVMVKRNKIVFEDKSPGLRGFLDAVEKFGDELFESSVADRIVGKAVAMLCAYCKIKGVYAITLSQGGKKALENFRIYYEFENLVPKILDMKKKDVCPFEKLAEKLSDPEEAYEKLKICLRKEVL